MEIKIGGIQSYIKDFLEKFNIKINSIVSLKGGTISTVFLVNNKYVIKFLNTAQLKSEYYFFKTYNFSPYEKVVYVDKNFNYIVYKYFKGKTGLENFNFSYFKYNLYLIKNQKEIKSKGYGYLTDLKPTFSEYLKDEVDYSYQDSKTFLVKNEYDFVLMLIQKYSKFKSKKKLLHGDSGTHNILVSNKNIICVIDPDPVIGDSLYDLFSFICSNINILKNLNLKYIYKKFDENKEKINLMFMIVLFIRLSRCNKYHKEDLEEYIYFWNYYKRILFNNIA